VTQRGATQHGRENENSTIDVPTAPYVRVTPTIETLSRLYRSNVEAKATAKRGSGTA
jgi:hypothetical protein